MTDRLPHEKGFHVSWDQIHRDSRALAWRLDGEGPDDGAWRAVVAITRGGMAPAMIVSRELDIRTVDTISIKSYHSGGGKADQRREAEILKSPDPELMGDGEGILIVDDLVDTKIALLIFFMIIITFLILGVMFLFYQLIYGILLRKLRRNYKELAKFEEE